MAYKPTPGVLTEEDKVRRLLGEMGENVEIDPILQKPFDAREFIPKEEKVDNTEEPTPSLAEPSKADEAAEKSRISQMEEVKAEPEIGGPSSHLHDNEDAGEIGEKGASEPEKKESPEEATPGEHTDSASPPPPVDFHNQEGAETHTDLSGHDSDKGVL
jgi:hypothetical protein